MNNKVFAKLALTNLKNNLSSYIPYLITSVTTVAMFYIMFFLSTDEWVMTKPVLPMLMTFGCIVIGIFGIIFLFYTNSFLIKQRKKEFGLYNILGMEKKHICVVLAYENLIVAIISIVSGLLFGVLFSKLTLLILAKILNSPSNIATSISWFGIVFAAVQFSLIFVLTLIYDFIQIGRSKPIDLLHGSNAGEKEPKSKWITAVVGGISLAIGYGMALSVKDPMEAMVFFFIAVIFVIIGTYCLFTAGSIAILKILRKNKRYYYKPTHFVSVSGMLYRMKKNAVGLGNICILSTMVLVMVATTTCLVIGSKDAIRAQQVYDAQFYTWNVDNYENSVALRDSIENNLKKDGYFDKVSNISSYRCADFGMLYNEDNNEYSFCSFSALNKQNMKRINFIPLVDYNRMQNSEITLNDDEVIFISKDSIPASNTLTISGKTFNIKAKGSDINIKKYGQSQEDSIGIRSYIVLPEDSLLPVLVGDMANDPNNHPVYSYYYCFDIDLDMAKQLKYLPQLYSDVYAETESLRLTEPLSYRILAETYEDYKSVYGGLFFLCIVLGLLFITVTVLIIYYKQISEGYEDKSRFTIMQNVGMSREEVKGTIRSQVLTVFFLPLITAVVHLIFAFPMIQKMLSVLGLINTSLFVICTVLTVSVFTLFYAIVYIITARLYYKIVEK